MKNETKILPATDQGFGGSSPAHLRRRADAFERRVRKLRAIADALDAVDHQAPPPLTGKVAAAADFIRRYPRRGGEEISKAIGCAPVTFRKHYVPLLKLHGFWTQQAGGYMPPREGATRLLNALHTSVFSGE